MQQPEQAVVQLVTTACPRSPRIDQQAPGDSTFYRYYAGYSEDFVRDAIRALPLNPGATVLDPWNGSGTTTATVFDERHRAIGYDANPAMVIVARARVANSDAQSLNETAQLIASLAASNQKERLNSEPLTQWLSPTSAATFRALERAIRYRFCATDGPGSFTTNVEDWVADDAAVLYTALFRALRAVASSLSVSNPTWMKAPAGRSRLRPTEIKIYSAFLSEVRSLSEVLKRRNGSGGLYPRPTIDVCTSQKLPLANASVDAVVTSPPYCTRIDYAVATKFELALLQQTDPVVFKRLRDTLIGTPTIWLHETKQEPLWGATCLTTLDAIYAHESRASKTYYTRYYHQYFATIFRSLSEISRVLRKGARLIIVVQDSFYKQLHIDLQQIVIEMCESIELSPVNRFDFPKPLTMSRLNPRSWKYRTHEPAVETALVLART